MAWPNPLHVHPHPLVSHPNAFWAWLLSWAHPQLQEWELNAVAVGTFLEWHRRQWGLAEALPSECFAYVAGPYRDLFKVAVAFEVTIDQEPHLFLLDAETRHRGPHPNLRARAEEAQRRFQGHTVVAIDHALGMLPGEDQAPPVPWLQRLDLGACLQDLARAPRDACASPEFGLYEAYGAWLQQRHSEEAQWVEDFGAQPNAHWLTDVVDKQEDLLSLLRVEEAVLWRQGMQREAHERALRRAALLQWRILQRLAQGLEAAGLGGAGPLKLKRSTQPGAPWTELRLWANIQMGPQDSTHLYRIGLDRGGPMLTLNFHRPPSHWTEARARTAQAHREGLGAAWAKAAEGVGLADLWSTAKGPEIARIPLLEHWPPGGEGDVDGLLAKVLRVHEAFEAGWTPSPKTKGGQKTPPSCPAQAPQA